MDVIFGIANGRLPVDDNWFRYNNRVDLVGVDIEILSIEELIASKIYIAARDRFDGADVVHLIMSAQGQLDWDRIIERLGRNSQLLLWYLILFDFVYPGRSEFLPKDLMEQMFEEVRMRWSLEVDPKTFKGLLLDQFTFRVDVEDWRFKNPLKTDPVVNGDGELVRSGQQ